MQILLLSMPDSFGPRRSIAVRMPNEALGSLAGTSTAITESPQPHSRSHKRPSDRRFCP